MSESTLEQRFRLGAIWLFILASVYFAALGLYLPACVTMIACTSYVATYFNKEQMLEYRYVDWILTTPIIIFAILTKAGIPIPQTTFVMIAGVLMNLIGYMGRKETNPANTYLWYTLSMATFVPVVVALLMSAGSSSSAAMILVFWLLYQIFWIAQTTGQMSVERENQIVLFMDIVAKIAFGLLL